MKLRLFIFFLFMVLLRTSNAAQFAMSSIRVSPYKVDDYIHAAVTLQARGREAACQVLLESAKSSSSFDPRIFVLCRMLFMQHGTNEFRRPAPDFSAYSPSPFIGQAADWRLTPIELVDGIPFWLAGSGGRSDGGNLPESPESYLKFCMTNCDWSTYHFSERTVQQKRDALEKLLSSDKFRQPATDFARKFFEAQIE